MKSYTKAVLVIGIGFITIIIGIAFFIFFQQAFYGDRGKISTITAELTEEMQNKYGVVVTDSIGFYTMDVGYGATLTTEGGIEFEAWSSAYGSKDTYMEEVWRTKALARWGYAQDYIQHVKNVDVNVGYRTEEMKDIQKLAYPIEEVSGSLWMCIYIDLTNSFKEKDSSEIEEQILQYYKQLQKDHARQVELIVRHANDSGAYMIVKGEDGNIPTLHTARDVSKTLFK
ncbi:hypothetical protein [Bacillus suaedaesalsae]|uniref:DUF3139 domain-containing protein n=1 Tax=Bacillus suaedaesalsae TaxID=2810349 RepID=A0ABS2DGR7_9BACI|nr:hypothetical protein [Bacillus suaedaesalsae]MBM6617676.1 hypothetical protein [Bacillus suaedaesalsae]